MSSAGDWYLDLKRLLVANPYAVLDMVFAFQDRIELVEPLTACHR